MGGNIITLSAKFEIEIAQGVKLLFSEVSRSLLA
jgi:hypothetical protein